MDLWTLVEQFGLPIGMLLFAVTAYHFDLIVSGSRYREVRRQRDQLLRLAVSGTRVGERSASVAERALDALASQKDADDGAGSD